MAWFRHLTLQSTNLIIERHTQHHALGIVNLIPHISERLLLKTSFVFQIDVSHWPQVWTLSSKTQSKVFLTNAWAFGWRTIDCFLWVRFSLVQKTPGTFKVRLSSTSKLIVCSNCKSELILHCLVYHFSSHWGVFWNEKTLLCTLHCKCHIFLFWFRYFHGVSVHFFHISILGVLLQDLNPKVLFCCIKKTFLLFLESGLF